MDYKCVECGKVHTHGAKWQHEVRDGVWRCTGKPGKGCVVQVEVRADERKDVPVLPKKKLKPMPTRAEYNSYMREYMRMRSERLRNEAKES